MLSIFLQCEWGTIQPLLYWKVMFTVLYLINKLPGSILQLGHNTCYCIGICKPMTYVVIMVKGDTSTVDWSIVDGLIWVILDYYVVVHFLYDALWTGGHKLLLSYYQLDVLRGGCHLICLIMLNSFWKTGSLLLLCMVALCTFGLLPDKRSGTQGKKNVSK